MATQRIPVDDPYRGLAASVVTSNVIDLRDAIYWSWSWRTTSGTTSQHTLQLSNTSIDVASDMSGAPEAGWMSYATFGTAAPAIAFGSAGAAWGRIVRTPSGASVVVELNKMIRT